MGIAADCERVADTLQLTHERDTLDGGGSTHATFRCRW